jgi:hypothetical protein
MSDNYAYFICSVCGSDDVRIVSWTRPNSPDPERGVP